MRSDVVDVAVGDAAPTEVAMHDRIAGEAPGCGHPAVHPERVHTARTMSLPEPELVRVAAMFKLIGDPTRARLLYALLATGELCVCDLAAATGHPESTVSQALRMLRAAAVVVGRRQGRMVYYRIADAHVASLLDVSRRHVGHDQDAAP